MATRVQPLDIFRQFIIGTMQLAALLVFIALVVLGGIDGFRNGQDFMTQYGLGDVHLPPALYAVIGAVVGWVVASVTMGVLFVLLDIQDGIRDVLRDLHKQEKK
jgi:hypothetical protein